MLENVWQDNEFTAEGTISHERVHTQGIVKRGDTVYVYEFNVYSEQLSLSGKCDCIEAYSDDQGYEFPFYQGKFRICPIEYKHGVVRDEEEYNIQLCAQAMCIEEMYGCKISSGIIFYTNAHRRIDVIFDDRLRYKVTSTAKALSEMISTMHIPHTKQTPKCKKCSLKDICLPSLKESARAHNMKVHDIAVGGEVI